MDTPIAPIKKERYSKRLEVATDLANPNNVNAREELEIIKAEFFRGGLFLQSLLEAEGIKHESFFGDNIVKKENNIENSENSDSEGDEFEADIADFFNFISSVPK